MVNLLIGHKGSGKTKKMIELANDEVQTADGSIIFINKNHITSYDADADDKDLHEIRPSCGGSYAHCMRIA